MRVIAIVTSPPLRSIGGRRAAMTTKKPRSGANRHLENETKRASRFHTRDATAITHNHWVFLIRTSNFHIKKRVVSKSTRVFIWFGQRWNWAVNQTQKSCKKTDLGACFGNTLQQCRSSSVRLTPTRFPPIPLTTFT